MNVDAEMAIYSDAGSNPAISIYNLFKSVDRYLKYQYINTFLFLPAAVRRHLTKKLRTVYPASILNRGCLFYLYQKPLSSWLFSNCLEVLLSLR